jgi:uncharacterized protein
MSRLLPLALGLLSGVGLVLAGVEQPAAILNAFRYDGHWDPRLWLFFAGAFGVALPLHALLRRHGVTRDGAPLPVPEARPIDARLIAGALLFGVGWGLAGSCPGPAVTALGSGTPRSIVFAGSLLLGFALAGRRAGSRCALDAGSARADLRSATGAGAPSAPSTPLRR